MGALTAHARQPLTHAALGIGRTCLAHGSTREEGTETFLALIPATAVPISVTGTSRLPARNGGSRAHSAATDVTRAAVRIGRTRRRFVAAWGWWLGAMARVIAGRPRCDTDRAWTAQLTNVAARLALTTVADVPRRADVIGTTWITLTTTRNALTVLADVARSTNTSRATAGPGVPAFGIRQTEAILAAQGRIVTRVPGAARRVRASTPHAESVEANGPDLGARCTRCTARRAFRSTRRRRRSCTDPVDAVEVRTTITRTLARPPGTHASRWRRETRTILAGKARPQARAPRATGFLDVPARDAE